RQAGTVDDEAMRRTGIEDAVVQDCGPAAEGVVNGDADVLALRHGQRESRLRIERIGISLREHMRAGQVYAHLYHRTVFESAVVVHLTQAEPVDAGRQGGGLIRVSPRFERRARTLHEAEDRPRRLGLLRSRAGCVLDLEAGVVRL